MSFSKASSSPKEKEPPQPIKKYMPIWRILKKNAFSMKSRIGSILSERRTMPIIMRS
jgi:hypothetical protein